MYCPKTLVASTVIVQDWLGARFMLETEIVLLPGLAVTIEPLQDEVMLALGATTILDGRLSVKKAPV